MRRGSPAAPTLSDLPLNVRKETTDLRLLLKEEIHPGLIMTYKGDRHASPRMKLRRPKAPGRPQASALSLKAPLLVPGEQDRDPQS